MSSSNPQFIQLQRKYEGIVRDFVTQRNGTFFVLSDDSTFMNTLRTAMYKHLVVKGGTVRHIADREILTKEMADATAAKKTVVLLLERDIEGRSNVEFIKYLRTDYPEAYIVVLTTELEKERLILFYEMGANNYIIKPISLNVLVEKLANTIKPQSKLAQAIEKAKKLLRGNEFEKALKIADKILEIKPDSAAGLMVKGDALKGLSRRKEAHKAYEQARDSAHMYLEPLKKLADFYKEEKDTVRQLEILEVLDELSPLNIERKLSMGSLLMVIGELQRAEDKFDEAVKLMTRQAYTQVSGISKSIANRVLPRSPRMAEKYLRHSLQIKSQRNLLNKKDLEDFNKLGMALRQQGKWKEAVNEYRKALRLAPDEPVLHYNIALALSEGEVFEEAAVEMEAALEKNPDFPENNPVIIFSIAYTFHKAGNQERALPFMEKAQQLTPDNPDVVKLRENIDLAMGKK
jgi:tetratricopeptide (TPR) repeat protein